MAVTLDVEKLFVSKVLQERSLQEVSNIEPEFISNEKYQAAYRYIREYYGQHGQVPSIRVFMADNPTVDIVAVDGEPMSDISERLINKYKTGILTDGLAGLFPTRDSIIPVEEATNLMAKVLADLHLSVQVTTDVDMTQNGPERLAWYQNRRDNPHTLVGVTTGFPTIDRATQGLQPGHLVTVTGLTKASKSTLALLLAMAGQEAGETIAYFTYEQTVEEQGRRLDAYRAGFNDNKLNSGNLSEEDWKALTRSVHKTENLPPLVISQNTMTVSAIAAKVDACGAQVVIIDGVYFMEDERGEKNNSPQALWNIVRDLKNLATNRKICIVAVTQSTPARTKGETLNNDSIMGSRAFGQFSNVVMGIERVEGHIDMRFLRILFSRSCAPCDVMLEFDYDTGTFEEIPDFNLDEEMEGLMNDTRFDGDNY
jgi:archaellum biogenesis ATPase FlaH